MLTLVLLIGGIVCILFAGGIIFLQWYKISRGKIVIDSNYNGPAQVKNTLHIVIRYILKRSIYFRKFFMQYVLHIMLRLIRFIDVTTSLLYAKSRNWFVKNAVQNRGTVPHFWEHLKVYKQEMDQEKKEEEL